MEVNDVLVIRREHRLRGEDSFSHLADQRTDNMPTGHVDTRQVNETKAKSSNTSSKRDFAISKRRPKLYFSRLFTLSQDQDNTLFFSPRGV